MSITQEKLLEECNLHTLVRLPNSVFAPYTGIKTNILFLEKGNPTETVWYYEQQLPEGVKAYNKTKPMQFEEFGGCMQWWGDTTHKNREENEVAWQVNIDEIKSGNYNLDIKNPHVGEQITHDPEALLSLYNEQQQSISEIRNQLKNILSSALSDKGSA